MKTKVIDIEVYRGNNDYDWTLLVGELDVETKKITIHELTARDQERGYFFRCKRVVGFNFYRYDIHVLGAFNKGENVYEASQKIILGGSKYLENKMETPNTFKHWKDKHRKGLPFIYDMADNQFNLRMSVGMSLKNKYFSTFGYDVWEGLKDSKEQFETPNYYREHKEQCLTYLRRDLQATYELYKNHDRHKYLSIMNLVNIKEPDIIEWQLFNQKITPVIFYELKHSKAPHFNNDTIYTFGLERSKYWEQYKDRDFSPTAVPLNDTCVSTSLTSRGGAHNAILRSYKEKNIYSIDYTSLYPNIIELGINTYAFEIFDEEGVNTFFNWKKHATEWKHGTEWEKKLRPAIKLLVNCVYGVIKFYHEEYGPKIQEWVCRQGRVLVWLMVDTILEIDPNAEIINVNTDGVFVKSEKDMSVIPDIIKKKSGFMSTIDKVDWFLSRDVNNFIYKSENKVTPKGIYNPLKSSAALLNGKPARDYSYFERKHWTEIMGTDQMVNAPQELVGFAFGEDYKDKLLKENIAMVARVSKLGIELDDVQWSLSVVKYLDNDKKFIKHRKKSHVVDTVKKAKLEMVNPFSSSNKLKTFDEFNTVSIKAGDKYVILDCDRELPPHSPLRKYMDKTLVVWSRDGKKAGRCKFVFKNNDKGVTYNIQKRWYPLIEVRPNAFMTIYDKNNYAYTNNDIRVIDLPEEIKNEYLQIAEVYKYTPGDRIRVNKMIEFLKNKGIPIRPCKTRENIISAIPPCHQEKEHHKKVRKIHLLQIVVNTNGIKVFCFCGDKQCETDFRERVLKDYDC